MSDATIRLTFLGGPTLLLEIGGLRFLTDPTFDPAGGDYNIGITTLHKTGTPARTSEALGGMDVVLLSHDQHADNLDTAGRASLPSARLVLTTVPGAARLGGLNVTGLAPWQSAEIIGVGTEGGPILIRVTATPARHGPAGIEPLLGEVIGFVLEWGEAVLYISGDTVWYEGVAEIARRFPRIGAAVLFLGGVRSAEDQPLLTMDSAEAVQAIRALDPWAVIPIHYEGWQHFREGRDGAARTFAEAGLSERVVWLRPGEPSTLQASFTAR